MDLLLVRCADAESNGASPIFSGKNEDESGAQTGTVRDSMHAGLSARGERHSRRLANWLGVNGPCHLQVFCSPAKSARQMAGHLSETLGAKSLPPVVSRQIGPDASAAEILGAVGWPHDHSAALVIAHQPALGVLASLLLTGHEAPLAFKKGSVWWFSNRHRGGEQQTVLRCSLTPELLKGNLRSTRNESVEVPKGFSLEIPDVVEMMRSRLGLAAN